MPIYDVAKSELLGSVYLFGNTGSDRRKLNRVLVQRDTQVHPRVQMLRDASARAALPGCVSAFEQNTDFLSLALNRLQQLDQFDLKLFQLAAIRTVASLCAVASRITIPRRCILDGLPAVFVGRARVTARRVSRFAGHVQIVLFVVLCHDGFPFGGAVVGVSSSPALSVESSCLSASGASTRA